MIQGYPDHASLLPGEHLTLRVSTGAPAFRADFYRCGATMTFQQSSDWLDGVRVPPHLPYQDWGQDGSGLRGEDLPGWPAYTFPVPSHWPSGAYIAVLVEGDGRGNAVDTPDAGTPDARTGKVLFVVRNAAPGTGASILYKIPLLTYHAYNQVSGRPYDQESGRGGWCLYTVPEPDQVPCPIPPTVSLRRPGGGTGGTPWDAWNFDPFDPTPRQTFVHWDGPLVGWLERNGYRVDYCTDLDVDGETGPDLLGRYRLLLSAGHDEYWTDGMRENVERAVHAGTNVAFFGGNTCWWRVTFDDEHAFRRVQHWFDTPLPDRPENTLTGVSFRNGGERDLDNNPVPVGYQVQHADHWVYAETGLRDGDTFGDAPEEYIVGYECDGAHFDRAMLGRGRPVEPTGDDGTPRSFTILGIGDVSPSGWGLGNKAATLGVHANRGTVFNAATTDWPRVLTGGTDRAVEQITRNVLDRLSRAG